MNEKLNKVAKITIYFWLMKVIATTLGETLGDLLSMTWNLGYTFSLGLTFIFFALLLFFQLKSEKFHSPLYWLVIVATTTLGTEISDFMDRTLGFGYTAGSILLFSALIFILYYWKKKEGKLEIYPIYKQRVEIYYWIAILFSNSLGTAFGDYLSDILGLPYFIGALITSAVILIVAFLHYKTTINYILLFWLAFIFTRPFGATFGDLLTKTTAQGGLNLGTLTSTLVSIVLLSILLLISNRRIANE